MLYALSLGAQFPGWFRGGSYAKIIDRSFLAIWMAPAVLAGLFLARAREAALLALVYPTFFLLYHAAGRGVALSYFLNSALFGLTAAALVVDEGWNRWATTRRRQATAAIVCGLLLAGPAVQIFMPHQEAKRALVAPFSHVDDLSLAEFTALAQIQDELFVDGMEFVEAGAWQDLFLLDTDWHTPFQPHFEHLRTLRLGYARYAEHGDYLSRIVPVLQNMTQVTLLLKRDPATNHAIREAYADCTHYENAGVVVIDGPACAGRGARVQAAFEARRAGG